MHVTELDRFSSREFMPFILFHINFCSLNEIVFECKV